MLKIKFYLRNRKKDAKKANLSAIQLVLSYRDHIDKKTESIWVPGKAVGVQVKPTNWNKRLQRASRGYEAEVVNKRLDELTVMVRDQWPDHRHETKEQIYN